MSGGYRFTDRGVVTEGAAEPAPERPSRPVLVELASAFLVVSGLISILSSVDVVTRLASKGETVEPLALLALVIGLGSVVLGVLVRFGRAWLAALNVTAIAAFLEITSGSIVGLVFGGLDLFVVLVLLVEQRWFRWRPDAAAGEPGDAGEPGSRISP